VRALIVDAGDPALVFPNSQKFREAAQNLELMVSVDLYMNETAQQADFVLPAAGFLEKDDFYVTFPDHFPYPFAQWSRKVIEPPGEAKAEWEIFLMLSRAMRVPLMNQRMMDALFRAGDMVGALTKSPGRFGFNPRNYYKLLLGMMGKVGMTDLLAHPHGVKARDIEFGAALRRLPTRSHKVQVAPPEFAAALKTISLAKMPKAGEYLLISGERSPHTKNTNLRGMQDLLTKQNENFVRLHPSDAQTLSVANGDLVEVATEKGSIRLKARLDDGMRPGVVSIPHGWGRIIYHSETHPDVQQQGSNVNILTDDSSLDSFTGMPVYNAIPCSLRAVQDE
jgi:formate dehydrogenase